MKVLTRRQLFSFLLPAESYEVNVLCLYFLINTPLYSPQYFPEKKGKICIHSRKFVKHDSFAAAFAKTTCQSPTSARLESISQDLQWRQAFTTIQGDFNLLKSPRNLKPIQNSLLSALNPSKPPGKCELWRGAAPSAAPRSYVLQLIRPRLL